MAGFGRRAAALAIAAGLLLILGLAFLSQYALPGDEAIIAEVLAGDRTFRFR
jgi:hypothetical protein